MGFFNKNELNFISYQNEEKDKTKQNYFNIKGYVMQTKLLRCAIIFLCFV